MRIGLLTVLCLAIVMSCAPALWADTVTLGAAKDNTLYKDDNGALSNGIGSYLFAGTSSSNHIFRGLMAFDVAGAVPAGSTIDAARLTLYMSKTTAGDKSVGIHAVLADWGEGGSNAAAEEGGGAPSQAGDATWKHTFYDLVQWTTSGGDFQSAASDTQTIGGVGFYSWGSTPAMVADVQAWLDDPASSFGWILVGDEATAPSAKRFNTRDFGDVEFRPRLDIAYTLPAPEVPEPGSLALLLAGAGLWGLARLGRRRRGPHSG